MKALQNVGSGRVALVDAEEPSLAPGEVAVSVRAAGVCGSDLHGVGDELYPSPLIIGHEFAGVTEDGRRVAVNPQLPCGNCECCSAGRPHLCGHNTIIGISRAGGIAERVAVPEGRLVMLPDHASWTAAAMSEVTATALHAINRAGDVAGMTVGIIGGGPIGIAAALCAQRAGAGIVVISEVSASRRAVLESLGIASVVNALEPNSVDVCIDAAGEQATQAMSIAALRPGGRAVWVGIHGDNVVIPFGSYSIVVGERDVIGSFAYDDDEFATAVELSADWNWSWVTSVPLEEAAATFTALKQGATDFVKVHFVSGVR